MKRTLALALTLLAFWLLPLPVWAQGEAEDQDDNKTEDFLDEQFEDLKSSLDEALPEEAEPFLEKLDWEDLSWRELLSLEPKRFLELGKEALEGLWREPLRIFGQLLGLLLLAALIYPWRDSCLGESGASTFSLVAALCSCSLLSGPLLVCVQQVARVLEQSSRFLLTLVPLLCGLLAAGGQPSAAAGYQLLLFGLCQVLSRFSAQVLAPLVGIFYALGLLAFLFPRLGLGGFWSGLKSFLCWGLGILSTVFVGLLSLQSFTASSLDAVTLKTSRFLLGSFVPVVGSILSDAFGAAQGCVALLKNTFGGFGLLVAAATLLPALLRLGLWYGLLWLGLQLCSLLSLREVEGFLRCAWDTVSILLALLLSFSLVMVVAIALVVVLGNRG